MTLAPNDTTLPKSDPTSSGNAAGPNDTGATMPEAQDSPRTGDKGQSEAERMFRLFAGLDTHHGYFDHAKAKKNEKDKLEQGDCSFTRKTPPTSFLWEQHLKGEYSLGVSPVCFDSTSVWGMIDIDRYKDFPHREWAEKIDGLGLPLIVCRSKSGGAHLYLFLREPMPTAKLRRSLARMLPVLGLPEKTEVFSKSDEPNGAGWVNMPYFGGDSGNRVAINAEGRGLSIKRFLDLAREKQVLPEDLDGLILKANAKVAVANVAAASSEKDDDNGDHHAAQFEAILVNKLGDITGAAEHDANNTLNKTLFAIGRFASELDIDEDAVKGRALDAWMKRGKPPAEFNDVWGRAFREGKEAGNPVWPRPLSGSKLETDFYAYMRPHQYFYIRDSSLWPAASIDGKFGKKGKMKASTWLDKNRSVEQAVWAPGMPKIILDQQLEGEEWVPLEHARVYNYYNAPKVKTGNPDDVLPWLDHIRRIYPDESDHLIKWLAHRIQRPGEKVNHAIVLGGSQGIGKDTILDPVIRAVGSWNVKSISPKVVFGDFNEFVKCVILRINEVHDLGDHDRYSFYDRMKPITAAPPTTHECNPKHEKPYPVFNVCGVIMTTNHKTDGLHLPQDDRRHYVAWSEAVKEQFEKPYWQALYGWYKIGGRENVAAFLRGLDLEDFDPEEPPKTAAWRDIVYANRAPEDADMQDTLEKLGNPDAVTVDDLKWAANENFREYLTVPRFRRQIPHRMSTAGYERIVNGGMGSGEWKIDGVYRAIYVKKALDKRDRLAAAVALCERAKKRP